MPRAPERLRLLPAGVLAAAALLLAAGSQGARHPALADGGASSWRGFVHGERSEVAVGQRMIVVLRYPSLADRVQRADGAGRAGGPSLTAAVAAAALPVPGAAGRGGVVRP